MKKFALVSIFPLLFLSVTGCGGSSSVSGATQSSASSSSAKVIKIGIGVPETHFEYKSLLKFKENVETKTNQAIKVDIFPSNQIGADKAVLDSIKIGAAQMNLPSPAVLGNYVKDFNIITLPFIFPSQEVADKVMDGPVGQQLLDKLAPAGYVGLGFGDFGFRHITNSKHPIKTIDDFKGLKIRTMENPAHIDVFRALGANPTPMSFDQVFNALQQGVIDGQENPLMNIYSNHLQDAQKYLTLDGHVYDWLVFVIGKNFFDGLTPDQQKIVRESAKIAIDDLRASIQQQDKEALDKLKSAGMVVNDLSPDVKKQMIEKVKPVVEKYAQQSNKELYDQLVSEVQKYSK